MRRPLADTREEAADWKRGPHRSVRHHHKDTVSVRIVVEPTPASLTDVKPWLLHAWTYDPAEARAYIEAQGSARRRLARRQAAQRLQHPEPPAPAVIDPAEHERMLAARREELHPPNKASISA